MMSVEEMMAHIVYEPNEAHNQYPESVEPKNKPVRRFRMLHRVFLKRFRFLNEDAQHQQHSRKYGPDSEASAPDGTQMLVATCR